MPLPRPIPKQVFQGVALLTLLVALTATVEVCRSDLPPYTWLTGLGEPLAWVLTGVLVLVVWAVLILPVRLFSTMPTLSEELAEAGARDLGELYAQQQQQLQADRRRNNVRWHWMMAMAGALLAATQLLVVLVFWFGNGTLLIGFALMAVVCAAIGSWHLIQVFVRLMRPRAERVDS